MENSIFFDKKVNLLELTGQWGYSGTNTKAVQNINLKIVH